MNIDILEAINSDSQRKAFFASMKSGKTSGKKGKKITTQKEKGRKDSVILKTNKNSAGIRVGSDKANVKAAKKELTTRGSRLRNMVAASTKAMKAKAKAKKEQMSKFK